MENKKEYALSFTAEQINVNLGNAENAILHTKQTLTPEQQAQARENIGAGEASQLIDIDEMGISDAMLALFEQGGGECELGENINWEPWDVLNTRKPVMAHCTIAPVNIEFYSANTTVTFIVSEGKANFLSYDLNLIQGDSSFRMTVFVERYFNYDGTGTYRNEGSLRLKINAL